MNERRWRREEERRGSKGRAGALLHLCGYSSTLPSRIRTLPGSGRASPALASQDPVHPQKVVSCLWPKQATPHPGSPTSCFGAAGEKLPLGKGERILVCTCGPHPCWWLNVGRERFLEFMVRLHLRPAVTLGGELLPGLQMEAGGRKRYSVMLEVEFLHGQHLPSQTEVRDT